MHLAGPSGSAAAAAAAANQQGFVGGATPALQQQQQQHLQSGAAAAGYGLAQQQQQQPGSGGGGLLAALAAVQQQSGLLVSPAPLSAPAPHQDLTARLAGAGTPGDALAVAAERGGGLFTEHLVLCLHRWVERECVCMLGGEGRDEGKGCVWISEGRGRSVVLGCWRPG